jgi:hypothetical protein
MEYFPIRSFRPIENREENTDQDRTVLRLCDGFLPVPIGALCSGADWALMWGIDDLPDRAATALAGADDEKAHFVTVSRGNHVLLVVWSLSLSLPLAVFHLTTAAPADYDFDSTDLVTVASTNNAVFRDKDPSAPWFASRIGDRWFLGNGIDANVQWKDGALVALGPSSTPSDMYDNSRVKFPPCTTFAMAGNKAIFAAGNASSPKRVWIAHPPNAAFPFNEGIYSLETSFIDLTYSEATKITALSAFQNYITAHTDAKPVNLFDVDGTNDGWKCVQSPGAANASAPTPAAVRDANGLTSFYVGSDGEIYEDQAIRVGPYDKRPARDQDIATRMGVGLWNTDMKKPVTKAHTIYDRKLGLYWIFAELDSYARFGLWTFSERNRTVVGPRSHPNAAVSTGVIGQTPGASTLAVVITATGAILYSDLSNVGETDEFLNEEPDVPLGDDYAELTAAPTPTPGLSYAMQSEDRGVFGEMLAGGLQLLMVSPWSYFEEEGVYTFTRFWNNAYWARMETGLMDFGDSRLQKNYLELSMTWQKHSRAYVGIYAETDEGRRDGRWLGLVFGRETRKIPINLFGRRIRVRVVAVLFNGGAPALLRDVTIGWNPAGTT